MPNERRNFMKKLAAGAVTVGTLNLSPELMQEIRAQGRQRAHQGAHEVAKDENFWYYVQQAYEQNPRFINLESGYFNPMPQSTLQAKLDKEEWVNEQPSFYYRGDMNSDLEEVNHQLADFAGVSREEMVICRNTTEALNNVILGIPMEKGDEAIITNLDYPSMIQAFEQRSQREGIKLKRITLPLRPTSKQELVQIFEEAIGPKTKVILATHLINWNGIVLPVKEISDMAHKRGVEVISDSAHAFAHLDFKIEDLHCDYWAASLHKWLACPLGLGMMWMKKAHIEKTWPLLADNHHEKDDIRKFEHWGTRPAHTMLAIPHAIRFHNSIGSQRKEARLKYLRNYWIEQVKDLPKVKINSPDPQHDDLTSAIANLGIEGMDAGQIEDYLYEKHKIFTVGIGWDDINGARITPNVFNTKEQMDRLCEAVEEMAKKA